MAEIDINDVFEEVRAMFGRIHAGTSGTSVVHQTGPGHLSVSADEGTTTAIPDTAGNDSDAETALAVELAQ